MLSVIFISFWIMCVSFFFKTLEIMVMILFLMMTFLCYMTHMNVMEIMENFSLDMLSNLMISLTIWISFLMVLASFTNSVSLNKMFLFYIMLMMFLLLVCFSVSNLLAFYFFFESVLFPIVMLIFGWGNQPERLQAGFYMLMYTIFGSFPMFVVIIFYFWKNYSLMYLYMNWIELNMGFIFMFLMLGFLVKIPMFFFHLWLPKAHVEAPISGSMILAGILLKLGVYGIFRFKKMMIVELVKTGEVLTTISIWGGVMISLFCMYQIDIKALIAYSSVCHMGVILGGMINFSIFSSWGSLLLMIGHGLCSSGLFCLANVIYERVFTRNMVMFKGLKMFFPSLTLWWFLFSITNMSAPLTMNLFGEFFLSLSILKFSIFYFLPIMLIIFLSACYSIYMYSYINHGYGWTFWSLKPILSREYLTVFLHAFPMFMWFLKVSMFCKWI
uniref:NADH-ubiquinone oxidoreductase chain 4 n=1 Tax=Amblyomma sculptum TaxID=1581419 RepID=A0A1L3MZG7_AMBSC|nr:NADH dehydrogenase subunit 4 [Amblyomma sculptum]APH07716.1 NADH dehydrogenase subunit 4 [Amblyomma sculptum]WEF75036.1 NADH dehydrogenase subunit 4 [Amblyomma sculptum]